MLRGDPHQAFVRRSSQNHPATIREILQMQQETITREKTIQLSEEFLAVFEKYSAHVEQGDIAREVLATRIEQARSSTREDHRCDYLQARLCRLGSEWLASKDFITDALGNYDADAEYWFLKADVCIQIARDYLGRFQEIWPEYLDLEEWPPDRMPSELKDAQDELDEAEKAIEQAMCHNGSRVRGKKLTNTLFTERQVWGSEFENYKGRKPQ
jgi:hypothetical protein